MLLQYMFYLLSTSQHNTNIHALPYNAAVTTNRH